MIRLLLLTLVLPGPAGIEPERPVIYEIHFAPRLASLEFVEILNDGAVAIDLSTYELTDATGRRSSVAPPGVLLGPGAMIVLVRDAVAFSGEWPGVAYLQVSPWPVLGDTGDEVLFEGPNGRDHVIYDPTWTASGRSLERLDPSGPSSHRINWSGSTAPSAATPGLRNSVHRPDRVPPRVLLVERVDDTQIEIWFDEPVSTATIEIAGITHAIHDGWPEDGHLVLEANIPPGDDRIRLTAVTDLFGNTAAGLHVPVSHAPRPGELRVCEILLAPLEDGYDGYPDGVAFVEIHSMAAHPISIRTLRVAGRVDESGLRPASERPNLPISLEPGERAALFRAPTGLSAASDSWTADPIYGWTPPGSVQSRQAFEAAFRTAGSLVVPLTGWPFGRSETPVVLLSGDGMVLDSTYTRDDWYPGTPGGRSMERIAPDDLADGPAAWSASQDPDRATPARLNSVERLDRGRPPAGGDIVISEILYDVPGGHEPPVPEFVELVVTAEYPVDPNGLQVSTGTTTRRIVFGPDAWPPGTVVVASDADRDRIAAVFPGSAGLLEPGHLFPLGISLRNGSGVITLTDAAGITIDEVRYDDSMHHPGLDQTQGVSLERVDPWGPSTEPTNWTSSVHGDGATPGVRRRPAPSLEEESSGLAVTPRVIEPAAPGETGSAAIRASLFRGPWSTQVFVFDLSGRRVRIVTTGQIVHDEVTVYWDGSSDDGAPVPSGPYIIFVRGAAPGGELRSAKAVVIVAR